MNADGGSRPSTILPSTILEIEALSKSFSPTATAVKDVSLSVYRGEFLALLGPSGCGKTTLLRMIAGMETPSSGSLRLDGEDITDKPPRERPVNMVFQSYAVFPHMSVFDNVAYGLRRRRLDRDAVAERAEAALALVRLEAMGGRRPDTLSGGQLQRVALARALAMRPKILLLDEPLSALDAILREDMRCELVALNRKVGVTFILVTHDRAEALSTADRIAVMRDGTIEQTATPRDLYERPANRFTADFIGAINVLPCFHRGREADGTILLEGEGMAASFRAPPPADGRAFDDGRRLYLAVRPERLRLASGRDDAREDSGVFPFLEATVTDLSYGGDSSLYRLSHDSGFVFRMRVQGEGNAVIGDRLRFRWRMEDAVLLTS